MRVIAYILFCLGGLISVMNFYLSFLRYPLFRLMHGTRKEYKWDSGCPMFGSAFVALSLIGLHGVTWLLVLGIALIAIDTGGFHWFLGIQFYYEVLKRGRAAPHDEGDNEQ
jgi:hypothetical protein